VVLDLPSILVGLVLAIPIGIATNLASPRIDAVIGRYSAGRRAKSAAKKEKFEAHARELADDPEEMTRFLLVRILIGVVLGTTVLTCVVALIALMEGFSSADLNQRFGAAIFGLAAALGGRSLVNITGDAVDVSNRARELRQRDAIIARVDEEFSTTNSTDASSGRN